jgi:hypothetical protein
MSKKKYSNFIVAFSDDDFFETKSYRDAFTALNRSAAATIFALPNYDGANYEPILTKDGGRPYLY